MECYNCGNYIRRFHYLWANKYGECVRHFCPCGYWYDVRRLWGSSAKPEFTEITTLEPDGENHRRRPQPPDIFNDIPF